MVDSVTGRDSRLSAFGRGHGSVILVMTALAILVLGIFAPGLKYGFDDLDTPKQLLNNPAVHGLTWGNFKAILTGREPTSSYYPARSLSYALDYEIWGLNPVGFKLTNLAIHIANVWLVLWMVLRLFARSTDSGPVPSGWLNALTAGCAASLFAVHPLVVEPVAWVPGREELWMTFWILACFHCHVTAHAREAQAANGRFAWGWHIAATAAGLLACLSNAVAAVVPLLITVWDGLTLPPPRWQRILQGTAALWLIAAVTVGIKSVGIGQDDLVRSHEIRTAEQLPAVAKEYWLHEMFRSCVVRHGADRGHLPVFVSGCGGPSYEGAERGEVSGNVTLDGQAAAVREYSVHGLRGPNGFGRDPGRNL